MRKLLLFIIPIVAFPAAALAQQFCNVTGRILVEDSEIPIGEAVVEVPHHGLWAVSDKDGRFVVRGVPRGKTGFVISCLGYATTEVEVDVIAGMDGLDFHLPEENLALESVVVTAREVPDAMATSRTVGEKAIEHLQMVNASDISALLPGGKTVNPDLTQNLPFSLRDGGAPSVGNASFGTAVEVDGVRLSTNASLGDMTGASTRNIASTNIESIEVITGVPSAEYGDISSGIVKLKTRKGRTPYTVTLATNPRTKQASFSKGFDLGGRNGVLNTNVEYTRATKNPTSPYTSYSRAGLSLNYHNTFARTVRFDFGLTGNLGGMNTKDDPDAPNGEWQKVKDDAVRAYTTVNWQPNRKGLTSLDFSVSVNYRNNHDRQRLHPITGTTTSAVHAMTQGYYFADILPSDYFATKNIDSRELNYAAGLKASWLYSWGGVHSHTKLGVDWRAEGNVGDGEYYDDPATASNGYRPRPYTDIPYMHNLAAYLEEMLTLPIGSTTLQLMAGLRAEKTIIKHSDYKNTSNFSPRFNLKYRIADWLTVRAGWGITEKLPSFNILYPNPKYRDYEVFSHKYGEQMASVYYTQPYSILYNPDLRWQRNRNSEVGVDFRAGQTRVSLVGYFNRTTHPYELSESYAPFTYRTMQFPTSGNHNLSAIPANPIFKVDSQTGDLFVRDGDDPSTGWVQMEEKQRVTRFVQNTQQANGSPIDRMGLEFVVEFPRIQPIRTDLRLDGAYGYTHYVNDGEWCYTPNSSTGNQFFPYVGIYPDTGGATITYNGRTTHRLDANLTATTHIPSIRMIISLRLEATLLRRQQNLSEWNGKPYAFNVSEDGKTPADGNIYDGNSYTAIWPVAYMDMDGNRHPFTDAERNDPAFASLMLRSGNAYHYRLSDYNPYFSANLSVTKEIGDHVSISFYANNFTNSRKYVRPYAGGTGGIFTPEFYYGLTVRIKF
ncbi:MAG: TonB-dependent receptor [Alistipes senegalensis]|nr:TonB-dependent receptor [Bacteroides cellulosilyticus]MCM1352852.1 TonB-dependent receptor [Alistipes senegalensis]